MRIHFSAQHVSNVEGGLRPVTRDCVTAVDRAFGTDLTTFYKDFVQGELAPIWLRPWLEYEERAIALRLYHPALIPGLVQTEAYARMVLTACPLDEEEREHQVQARLARQSIFDRRPLVRLAVIVEEVVLRRGNPEVMREQLEHLARLAGRPATTIRVIPANSPLHMGWFGPITVAVVDDGGTVAFLDNSIGPDVVTDTPRLGVISTVWDSVNAAALPAEQSLQLIKEVGRSWT